MALPPKHDRDQATECGAMMDVVTLALVAWLLVIYRHLQGKSSLRDCDTLYTSALCVLGLRERYRKGNITSPVACRGMLGRLFHGYPNGRKLPRSKTIVAAMAVENDAFPTATSYSNRKLENRMLHVKWIDCVP